MDSRGNAVLMYLLYAVALFGLIAVYFICAPPRGFWVNFFTALFCWALFMLGSLAFGRLLDPRIIRPSTPSRAAAWTLTGIYTLLMFGSIFIFLPMADHAAAADTTFFMLLGIFTLLGVVATATIFNWDTAFQEREALTAASREDHLLIGRTFAGLADRIYNLAPPDAELQPAYQQATRLLRKCTQALEHSHGGARGDQSAPQMDAGRVSILAADYRDIVKSTGQALAGSADPAVWQNELAKLNQALDEFSTVLKTERLL